MQFININKVRNTTPNKELKVSKSLDTFNIVEDRNNYNNKCIPKNKTVYVLDLEGNVITTYINETQASIELKLSILEIRRIIVKLDKRKRNYILTY